MRALVLALAVVLALPTAAAAQRDFIRAYKEGEDAFKKGNNALAEQKFKEARDHPRAPKQSRKANLSGVVFEPFIPDYYLGVIAEDQGRHQEALRLLDGALAKKLIIEADKDEFQRANKSLQLARDGLAREEQLARDARARQAQQVASNDPKPQQTVIPKAQQTVTIDKPIDKEKPKPSIDTGTPGPSQPPGLTVQPEPPWLAGFQSAMSASRASLQKALYSEARSSLAAATAVAGDAARRQEAALLGRDIDSAQNAAAQKVVDRARQAIKRRDTTTAASEVAALRTLSPGHVAIGDLTRDINSLMEGLDRTAKLANAERTGVKLFLSGQYAQAAEILEEAVNQSLTSPRVYLFLASSRGAQALLAPQDQRPALVDAARKHYSLAKPGAGALAADEKYISPSILQVLNGS